MTSRKHLERRDVDDLHPRVRTEDPQHCQLSTDGLARSCWRAQQDALICMIQGVECLHLAESCEAVSFKA